MTFRPLSLRTKLIISFLVVIIMGGLLSLVFGSRLVKNTIISQAQLKVKHDLSAAWMVFNEKLNDIKKIVVCTGERESIREALRDNRRDILQRYLTRVRNRYGLDMLTLTDHRGQVIIRTRNPDIVGDDQSQDEIIRRALNGGDYAYPQIVSRQELLKEGKDLARKAYIRFVETPKAALRPEDHEENGLMLKAASSILDLDQEDKVLGVLYGGVLLNRNYEIVDRVKEIVYKGEKYKGREIGTVTIFQNDLRISTNVKNEKGERAIGTRVSKEVNDAVLLEGKSWIHRAFVVNDWYITAYEPIKDINSKIIGILYVGMLERPYIDITKRVMATFTLIAGLFVILLLVILYFSTTRIINPLRQMVVATEEIAKGDLSHKLEVKSKDEVGLLADSFNKMIEELRKANEKLVEWGKTLEKKVEERTKEIREMQAHLIQHEKLASLGKLAAGIAHEINNPLGGILIYGHLLLEDTDKSDPRYKNLEKIVKETTRCKDIVKGLLQFARPKEPETTEIDVNSVLESTINLLVSQAIFQNIKIEKKYSPSLPHIIADRAQLQQVFINIILNAVDAMEGNGVLSIRTYLDENNKYVNISITDTGHGIKEEDKPRLFEPFFTTKQVGTGTGLGLAVCYSIIQKHEGEIEVESELGKGTTFTIKVPINRKVKNE